MRAICITTLVLVASLARSGAAQAAQMQDWQLRRFLLFRSQCVMDDFVDKSATTGPGRFHAICRNTTFYPDGVDLECPDRVDEWNCHILTQPLQFNHLEAIGPSGESK